MKPECGPQKLGKESGIKESQTDKSCDYCCYYFQPIRPHSQIALDLEILPNRRVSLKMRDITAATNASLSTNKWEFNPPLSARISHHIVNRGVSASF